MCSQAGRPPSHRARQVLCDSGGWAGLASRRATPSGPPLSRWWSRASRWLRAVGTKRGAGVAQAACGHCWAAPELKMEHAYGVLWPAGARLAGGRDELDTCFARRSPTQPARSSSPPPTLSWAGEALNGGLEQGRAQRTRKLWGVSFVSVLLLWSQAWPREWRHSCHWAAVMFVQQKAKCNRQAARDPWTRRLRQPDRLNANSRWSERDAEPGRRRW